MDEFVYEFKIPKDRIAVLIGKDGSVKKNLEEISDSILDVDSKEGDVKISGHDSIKLFFLKDVIKAVARGFNPDVAIQLFKQDFILEIINLQDFVRNKEHFERIRGRVIGSKGKSRETIETLTDTSISVYGKTVSIIGFTDNVIISKRALEMLLTGSPHSAVFKWLEKQQKELKAKQITQF